MSQGEATPDSLAVEVARLAASAAVKLCAGASITAAELAALVGLNERTVHRMAREGRYPHQQPTGPGGAVRFTPADVEQIQSAIARPAKKAAA